MFFVVRSNDSFNFPLGLTKYIVIVLVLCTFCSAGNPSSVGTNQVIQAGLRTLRSRPQTSTMAKTQQRRKEEPTLRNPSTPLRRHHRTGRLKKESQPRTAALRNRPAGTGSWDSTEVATARCSCHASYRERASACKAQVRVPVTQAKRRRYPGSSSLKGQQRCPPTASRLPLLQ